MFVSVLFSDTDSSLRVHSNRQKLPSEPARLDLLLVPELELLLRWSLIQKDVSLTASAGDWCSSAARLLAGRCQLSLRPGRLSMSDLWQSADCMSPSDQSVVDEALHSQRAPLEIDIFK